MKLFNVKSFVSTVALTCALVTSASASEPVTRGEFAQFLVGQAGMTEEVASYQTQDSQFIDVSEDDMNKGAINLVSEKVWMRGVGGDSFDASATISQIEAAVAMMRYLEIPTQFATSWPEDYIVMADIIGLTDGFDFQPYAPATLSLLDSMESAASSMEGKPVIGISWKSDEQDYSTFQQIITNLGGIPFELPQIHGENDAANVVLQVDGIIVTGGQDINPDLYGDEHHPLLEDNNEARDIRDTSDYNLIQQIVAADVPMIAICRGMQMFNVALGGAMIQDLPSYLEVDSEEYDTHRTPASVENRDFARHEINVLEDSKWLETIIGDVYLEDVASWHHQALDPERVAEGLTVVAYGPEDVIEAVEYQANEFALGIQFHPERDALDINAVCDVEISNSFFEALISYASN